MTPLLSAARTLGRQDRGDVTSRMSEDVRGELLTWTDLTRRRRDEIEES